MSVLTKKLYVQFQSTLPYGSDVKLMFAIDEYRYISIHAPLRERQKSILFCLCLYYFNPRSLTGATVIIAVLGLYAVFQSTLPYGSDQFAVGDDDSSASISIHAPLRERLNQQNIGLDRWEFQSTLPYGSDLQIAVAVC